MRDCKCVLASPHQHFHLEVLLQSGASFYGPQFVAGDSSGVNGEIETKIYVYKHANNIWFN
jgi:hypothetical protein